MRSRQEIKAIAKERFKANYWPCVIASFLIMAVFGALSGIGSAFTASSDGISTITFTLNLVVFILTGPLTIGLNYFHVMNILGRDDLVNVGTPFQSAFTNFGRKLGGYLWMKLFLFLWTFPFVSLGILVSALIFFESFSLYTIKAFFVSLVWDISLPALWSAIQILIPVTLCILLFCIPGIIKAYSYAMTPYILADCPNVKAKDALKLSMRIMNGHKGELFVLQLSFLGWMLLSCFTFGLLDLFYVTPYMYNTFATYYLEVREEALRTGVITMGQLEGTEAV